MKSKYFFFLLIFALFSSGIVRGQTTIFSETFDGAWSSCHIPTASWTSSVNCGGTDYSTYSTAWHRSDNTGNNWEYTSGAYSPLGANSTSYSARYHSYGISASASATTLITPSIDLSLYASINLKFYYINTSGTDVLKVYLSNDGGSTWSTATTYTTAASWTLQTLAVNASYQVSNFKIKFEGKSDYGSTDIGIDQVIVEGSASIPMTYVSSTTTQANTTSVSVNTTNQEIIGIQVVTTGTTSPLSATSFTVNANGSTSINDINAANTAKIYYTGTSSTFATTTLFGSATPTIADFNITGTQTLSSGTNYFWLVYDIKASATVGDIVDGECKSIMVGTVNTPTVTAPSGSRTIATSYCTNTNSTNTTYFINGFSTTGGSTNITNNTSGFSANGYGNFTAMTVTAAQGASINFSITRGGTYTYGYGIWVDWNQDGDFGETGEEVYMTSSYTGNTTGSFTVPSNALAGSTRMRVVCDYNTTTPIACPGSTKTECEDYTFTVTATSMAYTSSTVTQASTSTVLQGAIAQEIIGIQIVTSGTSNPLSATSFTIGTGGCSSINDINSTNSAKIYYTGTSSTFATTTFFGQATPTASFNITGTQTLSAGTNYFWLVYDIKSQATNANVVDASCTSLTVGSSYTPSITNPVGTRSIVGYCANSYNLSTAYYINNFSTTGGTTNITNNNSGFSTNGYGDFTSQTLTVPQNGVVNFSITCDGTYTYGYTIYIDFNRDGTFDASEAVVRPYEITASLTSFFTIPGGVPIGTTRMRVMAANAVYNPVPCSTTQAGEAEDYTITITASGTNSAISDIISNGGENTNLSSLVVNSAINATTDGLKVWSITIRDGGGLTDADAVGTSISSIKFRRDYEDGNSNNVYNWAGTIKQAALFTTGGVKVAETSVVGEEIYFTGLTTLTAADGANTSYNLYITFENPIPNGYDGRQFKFTILSSEVTTNGSSSTFGAFDRPASAYTYLSTNRIQVIATKLYFSTQPTDTRVNSTMSPAVVVRACDVYNNRDNDWATAITVTSTGTLTGSPVTGTLTSGYATFSTLVHTATGTGLTLTAASTGLTSVISNNFNIYSNSISGTLKYANTNATPISNQSVKLYNTVPTLIATVTTDASGNYSFLNVSNGTYTVTPVVTTAWGGVTAMDVTKYQKHILGTAPLTGLVLASGDVNASSSITTADITPILTKIVGLTPGVWPASNFVFSNAGSTVTISGANQTLDIQTLCYGDANASYTTSKGSMEPVVINNDEIIYTNDFQSFTIPVKVKTSVSNLASATIDFYYNSLLFDITEIQMAQNNTALHYSINDGIVKMAYSSLSVMDLKEDDVIFYISGVVKKLPGKANLSIGINCELGDINDNVIQNLVFAVPQFSPSSTTGINSVENNVQVYPNPAVNELYIANVLNSNFVIYDVLGNSLIKRENCSNTEKIEISNLPDGNYIIRIYKNNELITRKFSVLK